MDANSRRDGSEKVRAQFGGRDALFGLSGLPKLVELRLEVIEPNPDQPRKHFDEEGLSELAGSIERHGLIQPITVRRSAEGYQVVAGERRFRAFQLLGRETIPAIISSGSADEISLIENLQREDLRPLEEAEALARLMETHGYSQEEVGQVIGKARNTVNAILMLNRLPEEIKAESPTSDSVSKSLLIEIARLKDRQAQLSLWQEVKRGGTVRAARQQKENGTARARPTPALLALSQSFLRRLKRIPVSELAAQRAELLSLKAELEAVIAALEEER